MILRKQRKMHKPEQRNRRRLLLACNLDRVFVQQSRLGKPFLHCRTTILPSNRVGVTLDPDRAVDTKGRMSGDVMRSDHVGAAKNPDALTDVRFGIAASLWLITTFSDTS